ncbi:MAG: galactokinase [Gemmatimonadaceae bacterium]
MTVVQRAHDLFQSTYGEVPTVIASAPGRVNIIGEHTDYNGGDVLPIALRLRTAVAVRTCAGDESVVVSEQESGVGRFVAGTPSRQGAWWDYVAGAVWATSAVADQQAVQLAVASDVPVGAGLSSSAAVEVATATALMGLDQPRAPDLSKVARIAHRAETEYVGVPCGIMDQFASALCQEGQALWLACDREEVRLVPFGSAVLVFDTVVPRQLRTSAYSTRRAECDAGLAAVQRLDPDIRFLARAPMDLIDQAAMSPTVRKRAVHVVSETRRVAQLVQDLRNQVASGAIGRLLFASHESLRDDYECSSAELDWFVGQAHAAQGVDGARLTGAGWGGCAIAVGGEAGLRAFAERATVDFQAKFGRTPRWWISHAASGASLHAATAVERISE